MNRVLAAVTALAILLASVGAGVGAWALTRSADQHRYPEISAFTAGQLTRVGPYQYCDVLNPFDCYQPQSQGELVVNHRNPIQLSVPSSIGNAIWQLYLGYEDPRNDHAIIFKPGERLAVTIPTMDPQRGRLTGLAVRLPTIITIDGVEEPIVHAQWSIRTVWPDQTPSAD